jgi:hypothetical protein
MALTQITPVETDVRWNRREGRPEALRWNGRALGVTSLSAVRDERAAYPVERGPRVTYLLETDDGGQATLVFDGRRHRWYVEAIDSAA